MTLELKCLATFAKAMDSLVVRFNVGYPWCDLTIVAIGALFTTFYLKRFRCNS